MFGQRTWFSIVNFVFLGYCESYLFYYNAIFEDAYYLRRLSRALKLTSFWSQKTCVVFLNFVENVRFKWKKKVDVVITIIIEYVWICLNVSK